MLAITFHDAVRAALDAAGLIATERAQASTGCFGVQLACRDPRLATAYLRSFLPPEAGLAPLALTLLTAEDLDLSHLVPNPRDQGRMYLDDALTLVWSAGELPLLHIFDHERGRGLVWLAAGAAPAWETSRPACVLVNAAARNGPWTVAHGAAVGRDGRCLLLAGAGRAGKTTAALACARAGWDYGGDDYVLVDSVDAGMLPLYSSARLRADMAHAFPDLLARAQREVSNEAGERKHELDLGSAACGQIRGGRIAAILLPRRRGAAEVAFSPARRADAFQALFTTTSQGAPGPLRDYARKLTSLVALAPAWHVDTGPDPAAIPGAFARFLDAL